MKTFKDERPEPGTTIDVEAPWHPDGIEIGCVFELAIDGSPFIRMPCNNFIYPTERPNMKWRPSEEINS